MSRSKKKPNSKCRKWQLRVSVGLDPSTGKYRTRSKRFAGTYTEAVKALRDFVADVESGKTVAKSAYTLEQYASFYLASSEASRNFSKATLSKEKHSLTQNGLRELISKLDTGEPNDIAVMLCAMLGVRRGEAVALLWGDVDFDAMTISVSKSLEEDGTPKPPKSRAGIRNLPMPEIMDDALRSRKASQRASMPECLHQTDDTPIVSDVLGRRLLPHSLTTWWCRNRESYGLPDTTIHELRHTYLSMMVMTGVHPKIMQELAGHASSQTTMDIHSHVNMRAKKAASNVFSEFIKA